MPKIKPTTIRIEDKYREAVLKAFPNAESFSQALKLLIESSENKRNKVEPRTQIEIAHEKTASPQITAFMPKEPTEIGENEVPPCEYASLVVKPSKQGLEYLAYCDDPKKTNLPKNRLLPTLACQKCYKKKKDPLTEINKQMPSYYCQIIKKPSDLSELPCIKNNLQCHWETCRTKILNKHKEWRSLF